MDGLRKALTAAWLAVLWTLPQPAAAQAWAPQRHVEFVSPTVPGGTLDSTLRTVQQVVQDLKLLPVTSGAVSRGGGQHAVAYNHLRQRAGDPHFIGLATSLLNVSHLAGSMPMTYTDVTPLALITTEYFVIVVPSGSPLKTGKDFMEVMRRDPGSLAIGLGSLTQHLVLGGLLQPANVEVRRVKTVMLDGGKQSLAVAGGHVDVAVAASGGTTVSLMESGKVRVIAVGSPQRMGGIMANTPTWAELGYKEGTYHSWRALIAPPGLTPQQIAYWEDVLRKAVESREFRDIAEKRQWEVLFRGAEETRKFLEADYAQMRAAMIYIGLIKGEPAPSK